MNTYGFVRNHTSTINKGKQYWKRILVIDDDTDVTITFKVGIEDSNNINDGSKRIVVDISNDPLTVLSQFKSNFYDFYDLLLVNIYLPHMNGFELCEKILSIDVNVKVCFMSTGEIKHEALREIYPAMGLGYFIRKPVTIDYLVKRIRSQLD